MNASDDCSRPELSSTQHASYGRYTLPNSHSELSTKVGGFRGTSYNTIARKVMSEEKKKQMLDIEKLASTVKENNPTLAELASSGRIPVQESVISAVQKANNEWLADAKRYVESNSIQSVIAASQKHSELANLLGPTAKLKQLVESSAPSGGLKSVACNEALISASGAFLKSFRISDEWTRQLSVFRDLDRLQTRMFRLPKLDEAARLLIAFPKLGAVSSFLERHDRDLFAEVAIGKATDIPWLRNHHEAQSVKGFRELHSIGTALKSFPGFDPGLTAALRLDFGDWRDKITFPENVSVDAGARVQFYVDRGFNKSLTDFPEAAFSQSLDLAGLHDGIPFDETEWAKIATSDDPVEEAAYIRTNRCHNILQRLERSLRLFINSVMTAQYGSDWPKKELPRDVLEAWEFKKSKAEASGALLDIFIDVADFTDYEKIICQKKHWQDVFQPWFKRPESVRESFQRLYPIRLATMHSRFVTKEDELYVIAEATRLLRAI